VAEARCRQALRLAVSTSRPRDAACESPRRKLKRLFRPGTGQPAESCAASDAGGTRLLAIPSYRGRDFAARIAAAIVTVGSVYATAWHNGSKPSEPAGYGLKFSEADRDRHFDRAWEHVVLELDAGTAMTIRISPSFWRRCSELRASELGEWLLANEVAPWISGNPPGVVVTPVSENRFTIRLLRRQLLGSGR
jgi:hypothetical protein